MCTQITVPEFQIFTLSRLRVRIHCYYHLYYINRLGPELFFKILVHSVYKM